MGFHRAKGKVNMKRFAIQVTVGILTFAIGVTAAEAWFMLRQPNSHPILSPENTQLSPGQTGVAVPTHSEDPVRPRTDYSNILGRLSEFVELKGKSKKNTFYISKIESDDQCTKKPRDNCRYVFVYWKEDNSILILYPPFDREDHTHYDWVYSMRRIDLKEDVVPTWKEVGMTNYLVPRSEADAMIRACLSSGIKFVIERAL